MHILNKMIKMAGENIDDINGTCKSPKWFMVAKDSSDIISGPMYTTYQILFPMLISIGILLNVAVIAILRKTNYQDFPVNRYLFVISAYNIGFNMFLIPISVTNNGCNLTSRFVATYYARFGWALPEMMGMARSYTVMTIAYDRFLANYFPYRFYFKNINHSNIIRNRIIVIVLFSIVMTIPIAYFAVIDEVTSGSSTDYIVTDFYRPDLEDTVEVVFQSIVETVEFWIPVILLISFNTFIVTAMIQRKGEKPLQVVSGVVRNRKFYWTNASLVMTMMTYLLFQLPGFLYISNPDNSRLCNGLCHNSYGVEVLRAVSCVTDWSLSILHFIPILMMNEEFKHTLIDILNNYKNCILSCRRRLFSNVVDDRSDEVIMLDEV